MEFKDMRKKIDEAFKDSEDYNLWSNASKDLLSHTIIDLHYEFEVLYYEIDEMDEIVNICIDAIKYHNSTEYVPSYDICKDAIVRRYA